MAIDISQLALPHVSPEGFRALSIINEAEPDIDELQAVILKDPVLAGMLVRHANSPLFRRNRTVTNVPGAIRVLGFKSIRNAIIMATLNSQPVTNQSGQPIWEHSMAVSAAARIVAERIEPQASDDMEFLGLIHDTGMLVFASNFPVQYTALLQKAVSEHHAVDKLELEVFGLLHSIVMARFLEQFRLPSRLIDLLVNFHSHTSIDHIDIVDRRQLLILDLSHYLLAMIDQEHLTPYPETIVEPLEMVQEKLGVDDQLLDELRQTIEHHLAQGQP
jgi:HD-like signal output (HDOD) protein